MGKQWSSLCVVAVLILVGGFRPAAAQVITAEISGVVTDNTGAVVPGATLTARNLATGFERVTVSGEGGRYVLLSLPPGIYTVTAELAGFATLIREGLELSINQRVVVDFSLSIASVAEEVRVVAETPLISTTDGELGKTITTATIDAIPSLGRSYTNLLGIVPGVRQQEGGAARIGGNAYYANTFKIDGMENDSESVANPQSRVTQDAVAEVQVLTNQFSAEFGRAVGGAVNVITRSGTNDLKGRGFFYQQEGDWNAKNFFARAQPKPQFTTRNYGGTVGGPVQRDRLHYFVSVERITDDRPVVLRDPAGGPSQTLNRPTRVLTSFSKLSYQINQNNTLDMSYLFDTSSATGEGVSGINQPSNGFRRDIDNHLFIASHVSVLAPSLVNTVRVQVQRREQISEPNDPVGPEIQRPSSVTGRNRGLPFGWDENKIQVSDVLTKTTGTHTVKAGINAQVLFKSDWLATSFFGGQFVFDTDRPFDPNDPATYPIRYTVASGNPTTSLNNNILGLFVEDSWKVTQKLTLNLGLRYDREAGDVVNVFKSFPDNDNIAPRVSFAWTPFDDRRTSIRGGYGRFYYRLYGNLGVGMVVNGAPPPDGIGSTVQQVIPFPGYPDPSGPNPRRTGAATQPLKQGGFSDGNERTPYADQVSIGVARELGGGFALSADYVSTRGKHNARAFDRNFPDPVTGLRPKPDFAQYWSYDTNGHMWYDGLLVRVEKRLSGNYQFTASYTLSKTLDDTWPLFITQGGGPQAWWNPGAEKALSATSGLNADDDERHRLVVSGFVNLPWGFDFSGVISTRSARRFNITTGRDNNGDGVLADRPNFVNGTYVDPGTGPGVAGSLGKNAGVTGGYFSADARISKTVRINAMSLKLMAEAYNVTNRVNFTGYQGNIRSALFNQAIGAGRPRSFQLGAQFDF
jgi:outer membrane receptor protein involved in Fe transport